MIKVYTLVNAEIGKTEEVLSELEKTGFDVSPLFGEYDFIVIAEEADLKTATATIIKKIHTIEGVTRTKTMVGAEI